MVYLAPLDMLKGYVIANITAEQDRERINGVWKGLNNKLLELGKEEPSDAVKAWLAVNMPIPFVTGRRVLSRRLRPTGHRVPSLGS